MSEVKVTGKSVEPRHRPPVLDTDRRTESPTAGPSFRPPVRLSDFSLFSVSPSISSISLPVSLCLKPSHHHRLLVVVIRFVV
ncbi:hypothetical protein Hanom_Chr17g01589381 [Helianthus anomalus]